MKKLVLLTLVCLFLVAGFFQEAKAQNVDLLPPQSVIFENGDVAVGGLIPAYTIAEVGVVCVPFPLGGCLAQYLHPWYYPWAYDSVAGFYYFGGARYFFSRPPPFIGYPARPLIRAPTGYFKRFGIKNIPKGRFVWTPKGKGVPKTRLGKQAAPGANRGMAGKNQGSNDFSGKRQGMGGSQGFSRTNQGGSRKNFSGQGNSRRSGKSVQKRSTGQRRSSSVSKGRQSSDGKKTRNSQKARGGNNNKREKQNRRR